MAIQVPARNGGTLTKPDKGETMNPKGRPKSPKSLRDALNAIKNSDGEITFDKFKIIKDEEGNEKVVVKVPNAEKLALVWIGQALKNPRFAEIVNKITGDYAPVEGKISHTNSKGSIYDDIDYKALSNEQLDQLEKIVTTSQNATRNQENLGGES